MARASTALVAAALAAPGKEARAFALNDEILPPEVLAVW